jgi:hypothetical protein
MRMTMLVAVCALAIAGCSKPPETTAAAPDAPYNSEIDVDEVMVHVMDPRARDFWSAWGEVYDSQGLHDVSAKTDDDWKRVEDGAAAVVLATNTLLLPQYRREPFAEWARLAKDVADLAMQGKQAAERKDLTVMEELGGKLDVACDACHEAFRSESEEPTPTATPTR